MFSRLSCLRAACVAALSLTTSPAVADTGTAAINWANTNPLVVLSNGQHYTKVDPPIIGDLVLRGWLDFDAEAAGRVKNWKAWPIIRTDYGIELMVPGLDAYKVSKSYGSGSRPSSIKKNLEFFVPYADLSQLAASMCNQKAEALRGQGQSDKQIFGKNYDVRFKVRVHAQVDSTGSGSNSQVWESSPAYTLKVRCSKWAGAQVPQGGNGAFVAGFSVLSATMKLEEQTTANGVCRVKTVTAMRGNKAGATIKYRFFHSSGKKSPVFEVKTADNKIALVNHDWDIPNGPGVESGWLWIEGVGTKFKTSKVTYGMDCKAGAQGGKTLGG